MMKSFLIAFVAATLSMAVNAYSVDSEGKLLIPSSVTKICSAYSNITEYTYTNRDEFSEGEMLVFLEMNWLEGYSRDKLFKHYDYVDMQRIVRDAYRTQRNGTYRRECCKEPIVLAQVNKTLETCVSENLER